MYERYSDRFRRALALANQEAHRFNHEYVGSEHLLLGLVKIDGVGANVLQAMDIDSRKVRLDVEHRLIPGADSGFMGRLPQTPLAIKIIEMAAQKAREFKHDHVGTEHLLLALICIQEGIAAHVLANLGVTPENVRTEIMKIPTPALDTTRQIRRLRVGIVGVSGYGGGEALRLCAAHPAFSVEYVAGEASAGHKLIDRFPGIGNVGELVIQKWDAANVPELDLLFASLPSGESKAALAAIHPATRVVDIGGDHRFAPGWTYGLADVWPDQIASATRVANPGCYAAATLAALAPLLAHKLIAATDIIIDAKSGVSGAGRGGGATFGFADVNEDVAAYSLLKHAQVAEMTSALSRIAGADAALTFTPHLIPMTRGILATCYGRGSASTAQCLAAAREFYAPRPFVRVVDSPPHTKWATGSNLVFVSYAADPRRNLVIALGAIDNLGKGAAAQAVQNANLMTGLPETAGLAGAPLWP